MNIKRKTNTNCKLRITSHRAFTLVEVLVVVFIFSLITSTFYSVFSLGSRYIIESKNKLAAIQVANEKMEIVRNLKYDDIGVMGGIPNGVIAEEENLTTNSRTFHVRTSIRYEDDAFDNKYPTDPIPNDYKTVKITVSWPGPNESISNTSLVSRFVPPGLEVANPGEGVLAVNVISNLENPGIGIPQSLVRIVNNSVTPAVNFTAQTDNGGNLILPGAKASTGGYQLMISKNGYETVSTIDGSTVDYNHTDVHASVASGAVNIKTIYQDKLSSFKIKSLNQLGVTIPNLSFHLMGGRVLGIDNTNPSNPLIKYNLDVDQSTGASGEKENNNMSPGQYFVSRIDSIPDHTLVGIDSITDYNPTTKVYTFLAIPAETKNINIKFAKNDSEALLINVLKNLDNLPIKDASVKITNGSGYSAEMITLADGVAFFPITIDQILPGEYNLEVKKAGFQDYAETVTINKLTTKEVKLIAN